MVNCAVIDMSAKVAQIAGRDTRETVGIVGVALKSHVPICRPRSFDVILCCAVDQTEGLFPLPAEAIQGINTKNAKLHSNLVKNEEESGVGKKIQGEWISLRASRRRSLTNKHNKRKNAQQPGLK